jgi:hypothetical protein
LRLDNCRRNLANIKQTLWNRAGCFQQLDE